LPPLPPADNLKSDGNQVPRDAAVPVAPGATGTPGADQPNRAAVAPDVSAEPPSSTPSSQSNPTFRNSAPPTSRKLTAHGSAVSGNGTSRSAPAPPSGMVSESAAAGANSGQNAGPSPNDATHVTADAEQKDVSGDAAGLSRGTTSPPLTGQANFAFILTNKEREQFKTLLQIYGPRLSLLSVQPVIAGQRVMKVGIFASQTEVARFCEQAKRVLGQCLQPAR
jgi:hypothetical protein